jgi:hypothetical protein
MNRIKSYNRFLESMEFEEGHESEELGGEGDPDCVDCGKSFKLPRNKADEVTDEIGNPICPECAEPHTGEAEGEEEIGGEGEEDEDY